FCELGAGVYVPWVEVKSQMPVESPLRAPRCEEPSAPRASYRSAGADDDELMRIFENTYGKVEQRSFEPKRAPARTTLDEKRYNTKSQQTGPEYLLVDGYNIIFAWDDLRAIADADVSAAREALVDILANYRAFRKCEVILVFDAYKVKGNPGSVDKRNGIYVVYTKEAETADTYIERTTYDLGKNHRVRVATSDNLEQVIILGHGALRISARAFQQEVAEMNDQISDLIAQHNLKGLDLRRIKNTANIQKND
ncbi:MAG: NYN domain-containing protein, partial [Clostridia bacterium]|nr:NYN domain-containing protein [Clostridia bacterium]